LVEIDTDKETHEIRAPLTGVLSRIVVRDGASVAAGNHQAVDRQKPQLFLLQALMEAQRLAQRSHHRERIGNVEQLIELAGC
jgi:multidrug resistance efflux pump